MSTPELEQAAERSAELNAQFVRTIFNRLVLKGFNEDQAMSLTAIWASEYAKTVIGGRRLP